MEFSLNHVGSNPTAIFHFCRYRNFDQRGNWVCIANEDTPRFCDLHVCPLKNKPQKKGERSLCQTTFSNLH